ncbi:MAG: hypothetical protein ACP5QT_08945 [Brevinematia bacterium]
MLLNSFSHSWRSFQRFYAGSEGIGIGTAYCGDASSDSGIIYNPAAVSSLYSTNKNFIFSYEIFTTFKVVDILALKFDFNFDVFSFVSFIYPKERFGLALSIENLFYSPETDTGLYLRFLKLTFSYLLLENLSFGFSVGPVIANELNGYTIGFGYQAGLLWKPLEKLQLGLSFLLPVELNWGTTRYGNKLYECYPMEIKIGGSYYLGDSIIYFSLGNIFLDQIRFKIDDTDYSPLWITNAPLYLLPAVGFRFLERFTGSHLSIGFLMDYNATERNVNNQYYLTFGFRGYGKNFRYNFSLMDGFLINLIYNKNIPRENVNISLSFFL